MLLSCISSELATSIWGIVVGDYLDFMSVVQLDSAVLQRKCRASSHKHVFSCVTASPLKLASNNGGGVAVDRC
jgi:hypothetical protein